jgi:hypothetical protein
MTARLVRPIAPATWVILLAVLLAWLVLIFGSNERADMLPAMAGCFKAPDAFSNSEFRLARSGEFITRDFATVVSVNEDKLGLSLLPKRPRRKILVWHAGHQGLSLEAGYPLLMRISADRQAVLLPSEDGPDALFARTPCGATLKETGK